MESDKKSNSVVLISGGSSGIGKCLAEIYYRNGYKIGLIARDQAKLESVVKELSARGDANRVFTLSCDLSDWEQVNNLVPPFLNRLGRLDLLINNAGIMLPGRFVDLSHSAIQSAMQINYLSAVWLTKICVPMLQESGCGQISFTSSVAGYLGVFGYTAYAPTKFALIGFAESLRQELRDSGISVSVCYPPDTNTPLLEDERKISPPESRAIASTAKVMEASRVAEIIVRGIEKRKFDIYFNLELKVVRVLRVLLPALIFKYIDWIIDSDRKKRSK